MLRTVGTVLALALLCAPAHAFRVVDGCAQSSDHFTRIVAAERAKKGAAGQSAADEDAMAKALVDNLAACKALTTDDAVRHAFLTYSSFYLVLDPDGRGERKGNWVRLCGIANTALPAGAKPRNVIFVPLESVGRTQNFGRLTLNNDNQFAACGGPEPFWK